MNQQTAERNQLDMYKKAISGLLLAHFLLLAGAFCVTGIDKNLEAAGALYEETLDAAYTADIRSRTMGIVLSSASGQRVVDYGVLENPEPEQLTDETCVFGTKTVTGQTETTGLVYNLCEEDYDILLRIVEAEAGGEDEDGKLLVANVILNRVNSEGFPDTVSEVVLQKSKGVTQFSPVSSGKIWKVTISEETVEAVQRALEGEDISQGAMYFAARKYADDDRMRWFDENLTFLFAHGGHEFFL